MATTAVASQAVGFEVSQQERKRLTGLPYVTRRSRMNVELETRRRQQTQLFSESGREVKLRASDLDQEREMRGLKTNGEGQSTCS